MTKTVRTFHHGDPRQLSLAVRRYVVTGDGFADFEVDAKSPAQAKWKTFQAAHDAGWFRSGFRAFLAHGFTAREVRR